jgi:hypothetical protein
MVPRKTANTIVRLYNFNADPQQWCCSEHKTMNGSSDHWPLAVGTFANDSCIQ